MHCRSPTRIYKDEDYEAVGCEMAENMIWQKMGADPDTLVVGLKACSITDNIVAFSLHLAKRRNLGSTHISHLESSSVY